MTEYHWRMTENIDFFDSTKMIVERHDDEKKKMIIYSYLNKFRELVSKREKNNVMIRNSD